MAETKSDDVREGPAPPGMMESLFAAQESALLGYARRLTGQDEAAQDIVQEAFMRLHVQQAEVRQPQAWLYRTVHNLALNQRRAERKIVPLDDTQRSEAPDGQPGPDEYLQRMESISQTRQCVAGLDARQRELVRLKFEEGLSYQEISQRTQLSMGNVGYLLHHALKDLGAALKRAGVMS